MKSLASDNYSGVCAEIMQAIHDANRDHAPSYGEDLYTEKAFSLLKETFGDSQIYFVYNGTAANALALQAITRSHQAIICADSSHIATQEVGVIHSLTGCSFITAINKEGKISAELIEATYLEGTKWGRHANLPKVVSISQSTEFGTVYSIEELLAISNVCKQYNLLFHMDGCRLANAAVALQASLKELTVDVGVDVLSFGGTKNGLLFGEAILFFRKELASEFDYIQKQGLQLHSKMRFLSAQFIPYLKNKLWFKNAAHANLMCKNLAEGLASIEGVKLAFPVMTNQLFAYFSNAIIRATQAQFPYFVWDTKTNLVRIVTSFDTTEEEVEAFIQLAKSATYE